MAINRKVYQLFLHDGIRIEIVAPLTLDFPAGKREANKRAPGDPPMHFMELQGNNPRTYTFEGLGALLDQLKPCIVVLDNDPVSRLAGEMGKWCKAHRAKLYCVSNENFSLGTIDTFSRRGWRNIPSAIIKRVMLKMNRRYVYGIFCINGDGKRIFESEGFSNVYHMPLGFDPEVFFPNTESRMRIRQKENLDKPVIAYFGRIVPEKGVDVLIRALGKIKHQEWIFMLDHFDEYATAYSHQVKALMVEAGILERSVFVHPNHVEIADYMNSADVAVVPSLSAAHWKEQYGRVAAEAMACGIPVIASDSGALPELLGGRGIIFPEGNEEELSACLSGILSGKNMNLAPAEEIAGYARQELSINKQYQVMKKAFQEESRLTVNSTHENSHRR